MIILPTLVVAYVGKRTPNQTNLIIDKSRAITESSSSNIASFTDVVNHCFIELDALVVGLWHPTASSWSAVGAAVVEVSTDEIASAA